MANHPWLTSDWGWVQASQLQPGEPVITTNGGTSTVVWLRVVPGAANMYNLTVAQDHTYAVGAGQWVVHNVGCGSEGLQGMKANVRAAQDRYIRAGNTHTAGGVVVRDSQTGRELFEAGPFEGTNQVRPIGAGHAENKEL